MNDKTKMARSEFRNTILSVDVSRIARVVLYYALAALLMLTTNTFFGRLSSVVVPINVSIFIVMGILIVFLWASHPIEKPFLKRWSIWVLCIAFSYLVVAIVGNTLGGIRIRFFAGFLVLFPLLIHLLRAKNEHLHLFRAFTNVMTIMAIASLVLWILGPIMGYIQPNCVIDSVWSQWGKNTQTVGYDNLLFLAQTQDAVAFNGFRNTGIFVEAPMYAYALTIALLFELFFQERVRIVICIVLCITILSSISVTGIAVAAIAVAMAIINHLRLSQKIDRRIRYAVAIAIVLAAIAVAAVLIWRKSVSGSGVTRIDDFLAGFLAWLPTPIFGNGFDSYIAIRTHMASFRMNNPGFSNSLFWELFQGGLVYFIPHAITFVGFFVYKPSIKTVEAGICFCFLWIVTIVAILPVTALVMGIGMERLCARGDGASHRVALPT